MKVSVSDKGNLKIGEERFKIKSLWMSKPPELPHWIVETMDGKILLLNFKEKEDES